MTESERTMTKERYSAKTLQDWASTLFVRAGLAEDRARTVADVLVEGDLLGHDTHGLQLAAPYLDEIAGGRMATAGEPEVVSDHGPIALWDGGYLPGPWLVRRAVEQASSRAREQGASTVVIRRSHHIACLAAYLRPVAEAGQLIILASSDPAVSSVAPFGGLTPVVTPNPISAGIPTEGGPILLDVSSSITTNGLTNRLHRQGGRLPHPWLQDGQGRKSDDPAVLFTDPPGTILPIGGQDHGHKGFALSLMIEAMTAGLGGYGRAEPERRWGASVFLQVIDPARTGGEGAFRHQMEALARSCRESRVPEGAPPVRLPGERGLERRRRQLETGVELSPAIADALRAKSAAMGVEVPAALG
ncbi:Ldh family oxidoreductase [Azospirillum sp. SYSU D00513]|uniref:Ldh family oxidoreductase n=1 Tax=Azospirillum sp. SYSU D00513 TaxID=2812561 RepID=UPI001A96B1E7|nr:Ldh family oxidoreductase [Azospirillum sp. SYSU D00513]